MPIANIAVWFRNSANGRFAFHGIPPGTYVVTAQASAGKPGEELTASATIQVDENGVQDVALTLRAGVLASGTIDLASLAGSVEPSRLFVDLLRIATPADWEVPAGTATPDAEGRFVIRGLAPGRYRVGVRGLRDGWMIASAMFDDVDVADEHLRVDTRNVTGGVIRLTRERAQVSGTVTSGSGDPVSDHAIVLFPSDRELWLPQSRPLSTFAAVRIGRSEWANDRNLCRAPVNSPRHASSTVPPNRARYDRWGYARNLRDGRSRAGRSTLAS